jgi:iron complex outermembrane receptor protein
MYPGVPESRETTQAVILGGEYDFSDRWTGYAKLGVQRNEFEGPVNFGVQDIQANGDGDVIRDDAPSFARTKSAEIGLQGRFQIDAVSHALALSASYLNRDSGGGFTFASSSHPTNIYRPTPIVDYLVPVPADDLPKTSETTLSGFALADTLGFMNDRMLLTLGTRRQNVKATNFDDTTGAVTSTYDASAWTPMAGLVVKPTDDLSLYTSYIQGLSQGTTVGNGFQNAGEVFPPYKTEQIEVGAKLQTGSFTNTLSLFQIEQPSTLTDNGTTPLPTLRLNGEQRNRGIEWATFGELTRSLRMLGGVTYLQGTLTRTQDGLEDGNQAAGTPPWMANLGLDWDVPGLPDLAVNGRVTYTSAQYVDSANSFKLPSWTLLDLGARYATEMGGKPVVFRASVDNVFDRNYWQGVFFNGSDTLGAPRTFRLSAAVDF